MRLYLIRHGETDHNVERRIQGPLLDSPLNDRGRAQAEALGRRFAEQLQGGLRLDAIYASPLKRAWETAAAVARGAGVREVHALPALIEFSWGDYLGQREADVADAMRAAHEHWRAGRVEYELPNGESPKRAWERAWEGLLPVLERHRDGDVALVAHGRINKIVLSGLLHRDLSRMEEFPQGNTSVTLVECDAKDVPEGPWRLAYVNRTDHLSPELAKKDPTASGAPPMV